MPTGDHSRPYAIGVVRGEASDSLEEASRRAAQLVVEANPLGYAIVYVFQTVGDRSVDALTHATAEKLARQLDAQAFVVGAGTDRRTLRSIADSVRMTLHLMEQ